MNITSYIKTALIGLIVLATLPSTAAVPSSLNEQDTVIIELNDNSKIVIITKSKADLASLEDYDINQMIKDLNNQLSDSVEYMEINEGKVYVNENDQIAMDNWRVNDNEINIKLGGMEIEVSPNEMDEWDEDEWDDREKVTYELDRANRTTHHFNIDLGMNNWLEDGDFPNANNAPYSVKPFGSWYVGLNSVNRTWVAGPIFLDWGLGISWYNWKLEDTDYIIQEGSERIEFNRVVNSINGQKSKLTASYINATIVPMFDFAKGRRKVTSIASKGLKIKKYSRKGFRFGLGGYAGYRIGSHTKYVYSENGDRDKDKEKDSFFLENFRYGLRAQIGWKGVELFGTYDLNNVFSSNRGPLGSSGLNAVSFGITL